MGLNREPSVPDTDSMSSTVLVPSDLLTGVQPVGMDGDADDRSFMHALSHDGIGMRDTDIETVLDWVAEGGVRPPRGDLRGSSRRLRKLWTKYGPSASQL